MDMVRNNAQVGPGTKGPDIYTLYIYILYILYIYIYSGAKKYLVSH